MKETYGCYDFEIINHKGSWVYVIYEPGIPASPKSIIRDSENYGAQQEARFAAIGHISLLENGEG